MSMTKSEARKIIKQLKSGKRFITRFQEDEWGIDYLGNGRFRQWSRQGMFEVKESSDEVDETALITLLCKYDYETIKIRLR
jgi:hypothetical protein